MRARACASFLSSLRKNIGSCLRGLGWPLWRRGSVARPSSEVSKSLLSLNEFGRSQIPETIAAHRYARPAHAHRPGRWRSERKIGRREGSPPDTAGPPRLWPPPRQSLRRAGGSMARSVSVLPFSSAASSDVEQQGDSAKKMIGPRRLRLARRWASLTIPPGALSTIEVSIADLRPPAFAPHGCTCSADGNLVQCSRFGLLSAPVRPPRRNGVLEHGFGRAAVPADATALEGDARLRW